MSRSLRLKQLLCLKGDRSLLHQAAERLLKFLTTIHQDHEFEVKGQLLGLFTDLKEGIVDKDVSILELAELVSKAVPYQGRDSAGSQQTGRVMRKLLDVPQIGSMGWKAKAALGTGWVMAYEAYLAALLA